MSNVCRRLNQCWP